MEIGQGFSFRLGLLLRFIFLKYKKFLCFAVCCISNGKKIIKKITVIGPSKILLLEIKTYYCASDK